MSVLNIHASVSQLQPRRGRPATGSSSNLGRQSVIDRLIIDLLPAQPARWVGVTTD